MQLALGLVAFQPLALWQCVRYQAEPTILKLTGLLGPSCVPDRFPYTLVSLEPLVPCLWLRCTGAYILASGLFGHSAAG